MSSQPVPQAAEVTGALLAARDWLVRARSADGGWPYHAGKRRRLEATCWALVALDVEGAHVASVLQSWPRHDGWLMDVPRAPVNVAFNALAALAAMHARAHSAPLESAIRNIVEMKGYTYSQRLEAVDQDGTLEAWPWTDSTFSWVEPTALCLLLLKKRQRSGTVSGAKERIEQAERMLFDRVCVNGGWNYGNKKVFGTNLWPYVPTTALGLLSLQDRRDHAIVRRSLHQLQKDVASERSVMAHALALMALRVYNVDTTALERTLVARFLALPVERRDVLGTAAMLVAMDPARTKVFSL